MGALHEGAVCVDHPGACFDICERGASKNIQVRLLWMCMLTLSTYPCVSVVYLYISTVYAYVHESTQYAQEVLDLAVE